MNALEPHESPQSQGLAMKKNILKTTKFQDLIEILRV